MRFAVLILFYFLTFSHLLSQNRFSITIPLHSNQTEIDKGKITVFYDHNDHRISKDELHKRTGSQLFYDIRVATTDTVYYKNFRSYVFGKLDPTKKRILFGSTFARHGVDTTNIIRIHYEDTLKSPESFAEKNKIVFNKDSTSHKHLITYKSYLKGHKKCLKNSSRNKKGNTFHFFDQNLGHPVKINNLKWYEDHHLIVNKIFGLDQYRKPREILIHADGSYFLYFIHDSQKIHNAVEKLFKNKNWDKLIDEYNLLNKQFSVKI